MAGSILLSRKGAILVKFIPVVRWGGGWGVWRENANDKSLFLSPEKEVYNARRFR